MEEGRFLSLDEDGIKTVFETGESQGLITRNGGMYLLNPGDTTKIYRILRDGEIEEFMELHGLFYDIKTYEDDYVICLGNVNGETRIKIFKDTREISNFKPSGIIFGSCLFIDDDLIYIGGFDEKNMFKVVVLNFAGVVIKTFDVRVKSGSRIISKIEKLNDDILLVVSGDKDSIVVLNQYSGEIKEIYAGGIGISNIIDINIRDGYVFILDGREIYRIKFEDLIAERRIGENKYASEKVRLFPYAYLMYIYGFSDRLKKYYKFFVIFYAILLLFGVFALKLDKADSIFLLSSSIAATFLFTFTANIISLYDQAVRVEYLLKTTLYVKNKNIISGELFFGIFTVVVYIIVFFPAVNIFGVLLSFISAFVVFLFTGWVSLIAVKDKRDIIIDLLKDEDEGIKGYVREAVKRIKDEKSERVLIEVKTSSNIKWDYLERWIESRGNILRGEVWLRIKGERIIAVVDFSKRDIRYSRFSIMMDFITFVKHYFSVNEIEIMPGGEKTAYKTIEN